MRAKFPKYTPRMSNRKNSDDGLETYNTYAETIGGAPTLRWKDNVFQAVFILFITGVTATAGYFYKQFTGAMLFGVGGLIISTLLSGFVLMILGWIRATNKRRGR
jgi:hypothetical protein